MKKIVKAAAVGVLGIVSLTACDLEGKDSIRTIENSITQKIIIDDMASDANQDTIRFNFVGYTVTNKGYNASLFGQVVDQNGYNSFMTLSYDNHDPIKARQKDSNDSLVLKSLAHMAQKNNPTTVQNNQVDSFERINATVEKIVPETDRYGHELGHAEACSISDLNYNPTTQKASFQTTVKAVYEWTATSYIYTEAGMIPYDVDYHNDEIVTYNVDFKLSSEQYEKYAGSSKPIISVFEGYVDAGKTASYSASAVDTNITLKNASQTNINNEDLDL